MYSDKCCYIQANVLGHSGVMIENKMMSWQKSLISKAFEVARVYSIC